MRPKFYLKTRPDDGLAASPSGTTGKISTVKVGGLRPELQPQTLFRMGG